MDTEMNKIDCNVLEVSVPVDRDLLPRFQEIMAYLPPKKDNTADPKDHLDDNV
jgi:hypothetical protein